MIPLRHGKLLRWVASLGLVATGSAWAQSTFSFTVPLKPEQVVQSSSGPDTWLTPWLGLNDYFLPTGGKLEIGVNLPPGQRIDTYDGWTLDGEESLHVNIRGHFPHAVPPGFPGANELGFEIWLTGGTTPAPTPFFPTDLLPWRSWETPNTPVINLVTGDVEFRHAYNMGWAPFSFTDMHLVVVSPIYARDYVIEAVQFGLNRENIYVVTTVPEPSAFAVAAGVAMIVFGIGRRVRNRRREGHGVGS